MELLPCLVTGLKALCATFPDGRKGRGGNIAMADFGLSAFAMFFVQSASFLAFQRPLGARSWPFQLPDAVRDRENSLRQLYPRHAQKLKTQPNARTEKNNAGFGRAMPFNPIIVPA